MMNDKFWQNDIKGKKVPLIVSDAFLIPKEEIVRVGEGK